MAGPEPSANSWCPWSMEKYATVQPHQRCGRPYGRAQPKNGSLGPRLCPGVPPSSLMSGSDRLKPCVCPGVPIFRSSVIATSARWPAPMGRSPSRFATWTRPPLATRRTTLSGWPYRSHGGPRFRPACVTTARMLERIMAGYEEAFVAERRDGDDEPSKGIPTVVKLALRQAAKWS